MRNALYSIIRAIAKKQQAWCGRITIGPRAIVLNADQQVLLVKHTYLADWYLPGGGVKRGESIKAAMVRELLEETGIVVQLSDLELFDIYFHPDEGLSDHPIIFVIRNYVMGHTFSYEIEKTGWFDYENLPDVVSPGTLRRLQEFFKQQPRTQLW